MMKVKEKKDIQLYSLDLDVLNHVFRYCQLLSEVIRIAKCCKTLHQLVFSSTIWRENPVDMCLVSSCFGCGRVKVQKKLAFKVCSLAKLKVLRLHLKCDQLASCLDKLSYLATVEKLHLRLDKRNIEKIRFPGNLKTPSLRLLSTVTIFGWPDIVSDSLFRVIGPFLRELKLLESFPLDLFHCLKSFCPVLETLMVEGIPDISFQPLAEFEFLNLTQLCIYGTCFRVHSKLKLPRLSRFEYLNKGEYMPNTVEEIQNTISNLPCELKELEVSINYRLVNSLFLEISKYLKTLLSLVIHISGGFNSSYEEARPEINLVSIQQFSGSSPHLRILEILDGAVGFEDGAFLSLINFQHIQKLVLFYQEKLVDELPYLLNRCEDLTEITFYANCEFLENSQNNFARWQSMEDRLCRISEMYPAVKISLQDSWWI